jgi:hypothetical protein
MSLAVETFTEIEILECLDWDDDLLCTYSEVCGTKAKYVGWFTCCGVSSLFCAAHRWYKERTFEADVLLDPDAICFKCKAPLKSGMLQFRPITGGES